MSFLLPNMRNRPVYTNILTNTMNEDSEASNDSELLNASNSGEQQTASVIGNENSQPRKRNNKSIVNILEQDVKRREKRAVERDVLRKQILESNYKNVSSSNKSMEKFFMSMCDATCELPEHLQMSIQRQLFNIVMEAREQHLMQTPSYPSPGHAPNYNMSPASSLNLPIRAVSPNSLRSNSVSSDYLNSPVHYSLQSPPTASNTPMMGHYSLQSTPTASSTPMMPPNTNDTELIPQFSQQNTDMSTDAHSSGHHVNSVQNPSPESNSLMTPQNTSDISTHEDIRSYLVNFELTKYNQ